MKNGRIRRKIRRVTKMINYILLKTGIKDLYFYFYIWRFILRNRQGLEWNQFKLRHDWIGRIYTVVSYSPEDESLPEDVKYAMTMQKMKSLIDWLQSNNLGEIIMPNVRKIEGSYSYLVKFAPLFYEISLPWFFLRAAIITSAYYIYPYIKNLIEYVSKQVLI